MRINKMENALIFNLTLNLYVRHVVVMEFLSAFLRPHFSISL